MQIKSSPVFEFYVYSMFRMRGGEEVKARIFRTFACGHQLAISNCDSMEQQEEIDNWKKFNEVNLFFKCVKRKSPEIKSESLKGECEFVSEITLTLEQVYFFQKNRVMV